MKEQTTYLSVNNMSSKSQKPTAPIALSEEQKEAIQKERRNNEAFGQRAKIALSLIPSLIKAVMWNQRMVLGLRLLLWRFV